jgi:glycosyltransferase involved in cell wall biosynthesis
MSMKKILYCITKGNFGGAQRYVFDLATHVSKVDYEVGVLCGDGDTLPLKLTEKGIRVIRLKSMQRDISIFKELKSFVELYKIFKQEKPDVIHLNSSKMGGSGAFVGRIAGVKKIIFTAHGFAFNEDRSFKSKKILLAFHWLSILLTHKTIIVSDKTMKDIDYLPFMKNKLIKIYNGIDTSLDFYWKKEAQDLLMKEEHVSIRNKTVILSIGELHKNKGYDLLIPNLKKVERDFVYMIIGEGEERENIESIIKDNHLIDKVLLLGRIENAYKYIKACDVFVLPSRTEAFPYVLLESGLAGVCVLASNVGGIPEVITNGNNGVLYNVEGEEVVGRLRELIDGPGLRDAFGKNMREKITQRFSLDKMIKETVEVYVK